MMNIKKSKLVEFGDKTVLVSRLFYGVYNIANALGLPPIDEMEMKMFCHSFGQWELEANGNDRPVPSSYCDIIPAKSIAVYRKTKLIATLLPHTDILRDIDETKLHAVLTREHKKLVAMAVPKRQKITSILLASGGRA
tara:strand:+ start:9389 stop:9802 length:414 start_codon:yes stop_codon:yes gene_type:complete